MRISALVVAHALLLFGCDRLASQSISQYGLPVRLGSSPAEVRKVLGQPEASDQDGNETGPLVEWYDSSGIVGTFSKGKLISMMLPRDTVYPDFVSYARTIVNGVTLNDSKKTVLQKMGRPTKVEEEKLPDGTNPDVPVGSAEQSKYSWRVKDFV